MDSIVVESLRNEAEIRRKEYGENTADSSVDALLLVVRCTMLTAVLRWWSSVVLTGTWYMVLKKFFAISIRKEEGGE